MLRSYVTHPTRWTDVIKNIKENIDQLPPDARLLYNGGSAKQLRDRLSAKFGKLMATRHLEDPEIRAGVQQVKNLEARLLPQHQPRVAAPPAGADNDGPGAAAEVRDALAGQLSDDGDDDNQGQRRPAVGLVQAQAPNQGQHPAPAPIQGQHPAPAPIQGQHQAPAPIQGQHPAPAPIQGQHPAPAPIQGQHQAQDPNQGQDPAPDQVQRRPAADRGQGQGPAHGQGRRKRPLAELIRDNQEQYNRFIRKKVPKLLRQLGVSSDSSDND